MPAPGNEHRAGGTVYSGMRLLCVGRHAFLSEHFCRVFTEAGARCEAVVGVAEVAQRAAALEPHVIVCDCDLLTSTVLDGWAAVPALASVPVLSVTLTHRPNELTEAGACDLRAAVYLPGLDADGVTRLLASVNRPRGVDMPADWEVRTSPVSPVIR